jgi:hypothetical protein
VNYAVDPYGLYRTPGEGDWKPHAATQGELVKPYLVLEHPPRTLILGNSRAEVGFDPCDEAWPQAYRPVFNLALPGTGTRVARRLFEHVLAARPPGFVVLGVDFMDFLVTPDAKGGDPAMTRRLLNVSRPGPDLRHSLQRLHDAAATIASLDALLHSLDTLRVRGRPGIAHLTPDGFNPMHDYERIAAGEGYFNLFRQRDLENLRAYQRRSKNLYTRGSHSSPAFEDVMAILDDARAHGIPVRVVIYPYHAHLLEILRITGCWELFEQWKRELVHRVASRGGRAELWDFSGYHRYAREDVPRPDDRKTKVHWYWEAGHFKKELGHQLLGRLFGADDPEFGVPLTPGNVEVHLAAIRLAGQAYRRERPEVVASLERLAR